MRSKTHFICGLGLSAVLLLLGVDFWPVMLILCTSILIDIDHVFDFMIKFKRLNIVDLFLYFNRKRIPLINSVIPMPLFIFHNIETLIVLALLSQIFPFVIYIIAGTIFHLALDLAIIDTNKCPVIIKTSLIMVLIENYRRKKGRPQW